MTLSWYLVRNRPAIFGYRPSSAMTVPISVYILGISSSSSPSFCRLFAYRPRCVLMNLVSLYFPNTRCCSSIICCQGAGSVSVRFLFGRTFKRSLCSSWSSQKGVGSAACMSTSIPNSPHFVHILPNRESSIGTLFPILSLTRSPRLL